ncbi:hypothetical protein I6F35_37405 [Bradyrhizobium sp. BRP22]|uniref:hypothetical protein n=1 Tax=Bradyrhizobium sp. BRP22 TaxID=2793821 RepID=UPI001CD29F03|nr:hypothetical protein [Bradyrhizobium sp. BRP22]MCA1458778.1 hypothetical protein [Bradyrhizobium sp. BRP22]
MTILHEIVMKSEWIIAILTLYVVAWTRFNSPPTNRSGTTFALFFFGVIFYYALIVVLWLLVMIGLVQGSIGFDWVGKALTKANPEAQIQLAQHAPILAALIIIVASQFHQVSRIDSAARTFCFKLAAIPREADRLAIELAQSADFEPSEKLRKQVTKIISENISPQALNFNRDGTLPARFTRAVALYNLFVGPRNNGTALEFAGNGYSRSGYARIMQLGETVAARADTRYEELMHTGLAFFTSSQPTRELKEALNCNIVEISNLTCSLVARYVLFCDRTHNGRLQRLAGMGFDARPTPTFGPDQWATTILFVILLSVGMMILMPGTRPIEAGKVLTIAITFGISIGFAVLGAIVVAQRFIERHEGGGPAFPPIAELVLAALIVAGLSMALRIGIPLVPALLQGEGFQDVIRQFVERLPGVITPFTCTVSLGLLCSYLGSRDWSWHRVLGVGAIGNALSLMLAGWVIGSLLDQKVLAQFYVHPEQAVVIIVLSTGLTGFLVGALVLAMFNKSERVRKDCAERAAKNLHTDIPLHNAPELTEDLEAGLASKSEVAHDLGRYARSSVEALEGRYVCFRPAFSSAEVINAYLMSVRWDETESCLTFEELGRIDSAHTQKGRVYIPDGRPFMSFVTVEKGAIRLIMVSRPESNEPARGLITRLSNPGGAHFTPASAPIVLRRVVDQAPQLGFIQPGSPDYEAYRRELDMVMPAFGFFAAPPQPNSSTGPLPIDPSQNVPLAVVR